MRNVNWSKWFIIGLLLGGLAWVVQDTKKSIEHQLEVAEQYAPPAPEDVVLTVSDLAGNVLFRGNAGQQEELQKRFPKPAILVAHVELDFENHTGEFKMVIDPDESGWVSLGKVDDKNFLTTQLRQADIRLSVMDEDRDVILRGDLVETFTALEPGGPIGEDMVVTRFFGKVEPGDKPGSVYANGVFLVSPKPKP